MLVLFDLDDTLIDHSAALNEAALALRHLAAVSAPEEEFLVAWRAAHRRHFDAYLAGALSFEAQRRLRIRETIDASLRDEEADEFFRFYAAIYERPCRPFPDAEPCLDALRGHTLGVVTNGQADQQRRKLANAGIAAHFEHVLVSEECGYAKPDPRIFLEACARAGADPSRAVYVGDLYDVDVLAARQAGLIGIWLNRTNVESDKHTPPLVSSLTAVPSIIKSLSDGRG